MQFFPLGDDAAISVLERFERALYAAFDKNAH